MVASRLCVCEQMSKIEYIGGRKCFRSNDERLLFRDQTSPCTERSGVGVAPGDVAAVCITEIDSPCVEIDPDDDEWRSGRANFICDIFDPLARAASPKGAKL